MNSTLYDLGCSLGAASLSMRHHLTKDGCEIISVDNKLLGRYYYQNRTKAQFEEIPSYLIDALIATEDVRFYKHEGLDFRSTMRVIVKSIILRNKSAGGGSTLSQQLAKNLYSRDNNGVLTMPVAKIKEIITAKRLEKVYSKEEILEMKLFGDGPKHKMIDCFLGDFVAIAIDKYMFVLNEGKSYKAHHAGLLEDEMMVPLIIYSKK